MRATSSGWVRGDMCPAPAIVTHRLPGTAPASTSAVRRSAGVVSAPRTTVVGTAIWRQSVKPNLNSGGLIPAPAVA